MAASTRTEFLRTTAVLSAIALVIASIASPPDPFTLLLYFVPLVLTAPVVSYFLTYRRENGVAEL